MSKKTIQGSTKLGETIRSRRQELKLTREEAAAKAGVGIKSWCRYESGESIRGDKAKGICKALNWHTFPDTDNTTEPEFDIEKYKSHEAWSPFLCEQFGEAVAISFAIGSDIVLDHIEEDLNELSTLPKESHIGEISYSMLKDALPEQFLMRYDYNFLYELKATVIHLIHSAASGRAVIAHSVIEELAIYLFMTEASALLECLSIEMDSVGAEGLDMIDDWAFELFGDMDIVTFLFSNHFLTKENSYHFDNWSNNQFYMEEL